jgi:iron complex outermembrane receptor protein
VEASLQSTLWSAADGRKLSLRQAYTFSDFHYRDDQRFGDNRLPGLPMHYYQGELRHDWPQGFFAAVNTQLVSKVAVDYANSYYADPYALFGATVGYNAPKNDWQTWLDLRNLTNKHYAAVTPGYDDKGLMRRGLRRVKGWGLCRGVVEFALRVYRFGHPLKASAIKQEVSGNGTEDAKAAHCS